MPEKSKQNGGKQSRIGTRFFLEIENIKDLRLRNGKDKDRISTEKITNMIIKHACWKDISRDTINLSEEEIKKYGL